MKARDHKGPSSDGDGDGDGAPLVAHALRADGFDASEDGTGRGTPIIPIDMRQASRGEKITNNRAEGSSGGAPGHGVGNPGDPAFTISERGQAIAFPSNMGGNIDTAEGVSPPLRLAGEGLQSMAVAFNITPSNSNKDYNAREASYAKAVTTDGGAPSARGGDIVTSRWAVRRLTPRECERLQGFPDDYTLIPWRGKEAPDGPRYKALGNSMAVNVMRWIGTRIEMVETLTASVQAA